MENIDINQIAITIADKISSDLDLWIAGIGAGGVIVGSVITILGNVILHFVRENPQKKLDRQRQEYLRTMLNEKGITWKKIETLSCVIGANEDETKRLLIGIKARGSLTRSGSWALISRAPLPTGDIERDEV